jgi:hypothetical protein
VCLRCGASEIPFFENKVNKTEVLVSLLKTEVLVILLLALLRVRNTFFS